MKTKSVFGYVWLLSSNDISVIDTHPQIKPIIVCVDML